MAKSYSASLEEAGELTLAKMEAIHRGAVEDTCELMTRRVESLAGGGTFREGFVPVDEGELINSFQFRIDGNTLGEGPTAYAAVIEGLELGDIADAVFTAAHARPIEYGFRIGDDDTDDGTGDTDVPGRFFVSGAVSQWPTVVVENVRYVTGD